MSLAKIQQAAQKQKWAHCWEVIMYSNLLQATPVYLTKEAKSSRVSSENSLLSFLSPLCMIFNSLMFIFTTFFFYFFIHKVPVCFLPHWIIASPPTIIFKESRYCQDPDTYCTSWKLFNCQYKWGKNFVLTIFFFFGQPDWKNFSDTVAYTRPKIKPASTCSVTNAIF